MSPTSSSGRTEAWCLSALISMKEEAAAPALRRYNRLPSITHGALGEGYALGQAIADFEGARDTAGRGQARLVGPVAAVQGSFGRNHRNLRAGVRSCSWCLPPSSESFVHPLVIMLSVPLAAGGASCPVFHRLELNLYSQIGIAADRAHGQERHPHRRVRQPAAQ